MVNARPGYWDVDRGIWVGVEPVGVTPLALAREHAPDRVPDEAAVHLPAPRPEEAGEEADAPQR